MKYTNKDRHSLVMNLKSIPNVNKKNIDRIFKEYARDVNEESKSGFHICLKNK